MIKLLNILTEINLVLKDRRGLPIGIVSIDKDKNQTLRSRAGRILGYYNNKQNITRDHTKTIVGKGNLLTYLITIYK